METCKIRLPQNSFAHFNRNKRLTARILQLRSTPVLQPCTQTCMADPLITELEDRRVLDSFNPHKGAGPDGLIPKVFKALKSHISSVLHRMFNLSLQIVQVPEGWHRAIVTPTPKTPHPTDQRHFRPIGPTSVAFNSLEAILRENCCSPNFRY